MTEEEPPRPKGLQTGSLAPLFNIKGIDGKTLNLKNLVDNYNGVMIDFFRGNW